MIVRRLVEPLAFLSLATAVHAAVWIGLPGSGFGGASGMGGGGAGAVTLAGSSALSQLARDWGRAPETAPRPVAAPAQPALNDAPALLPSAADRAAPPPPGPLFLPAAQTAPTPETRPAPPPESPAPAAPAETAAGAGEAPRAARAAVPQPPSGTGAAGQGALSEGQRQSLMASWAGQIRARVERRKTYPRTAQAQGLTGTVKLRLVVGPDGQLLAAGVAASSGHALLDEAALAALGRAGKFPPAPGGLAGARHAFTLPITFSR